LVQESNFFCLMGSTGLHRLTEKGERMRYSTATQGRVFVVRLEDGDILHESIEELARKECVRAAAVLMLGGADAGSKLVVGPEQPRTTPIVPMEHVLADVHEMAGVGTIFPDANGKPVLHMHMAGGRKDKAVAGCVRRGVIVWQVMEAVIWELKDTEAKRMLEPQTGFELLQP
jgi:predicted DNA-binding protein with PD1-like motif